jgi:hypothetical protein
MSEKHTSYKESGVALLITLLALSLFSLLGLYLALEANTGLQISDNHETQIQATYSALAGLNHARALMRGLAFDDLLKGPDGVYANNSTYLAQAKQFAFRDPIPLQIAQSLNVSNPANLAGFPDDGLISTGFCAGTNGNVLIPITGISLSASNPYGSGTMVTSRYFVKVTDNNGEPSEIFGDPNDNPFVDGDGVVIARSLGIAQTFSETVGTASRLNSVAVFEARFKRSSTFDLGPALVVLGNSVSASFGGAFDISGGSSAGIGTIDFNPGDSIMPDQIIRAAVANQGRITGAGQPNPSIQDISSQIGSSPDWSLLLDPAYLLDFINVRAPKSADSYFKGDQNWLNGNAPYTGSYDPTKPWNAPGQDPKIVVVDGNLNISGGFSGGGLLVVTGKLSCSGPYAYNGLVLVIGSGNLAVDGSGSGIEGGSVIVSLVQQGGQVTFGTPGISIASNSRFASNKNAVKTALGLLPVSQISFREIAGSDP